MAIALGKTINKRLPVASQVFVLLCEGFFDMKSLFSNFLQ